VSGDRIFVNLFVQGTARVPMPAGAVTVQQETRYPWDGDVRIRVAPAKSARFAVLLRVPGWAMGHPVPGDLYRDLTPVRDTVTLKVNGLLVPIRLERGFAVVAREWAAGDTIDLHLPMPVRRVVAHPAVKADEGRVALERGPLVYAAEFVDNGGRVTNLILADETPLGTEWRPDLLNGVMTVTGKASAVSLRGGATVSAPRPMTLIPYYGWAHRGKGEMTVWLARRPDLARPAPEPTLASASKASSSEGGKGLEGLNEQYEPGNSNDHTALYFHWWPKKDSTEWVQYEFPAESTVSEASVYWFDDTGQGGCRVPRSWRVLYRRGDQWLPVETRDPFGVAKDAYNTVRFTPVRTTALRVEVVLPSDFSAGIQEWKVR
jgi:hypothetical protein